MSGNWRMLGYVFLGGSLGTMLRYLIFEVINLNFDYPVGELTAIFVVNMIGSYFLGLTARHPYFQLEWCRNLWGVGFAGGFTTMSAVTTFVDFNGLLNPWVGLMMLFGLGVYGAGYRLGRLEAKWMKNG